MSVDASFRKAEGGTIGKLIVEAVILAFRTKQADGGKLLSAAAQADKADTDAIALKVKFEFVARAKAKGVKKPQATTKPAQKRVG
jgi:ParB family chromosome partitioning protein